MAQIELPWVEKYRPSSLRDVVGHEEITARLRNYAEKKNLPNMLFSGPAGTGKTSSSIALARELFGANFEQNFLELNASDDRGIDVVRNTIKDFARTLAFDSGFKIIFLDECDALTQDAQQALRRTMEKYTKTCRFILSCVTPDTILALPNETELTFEEFVKLYEERKISEVLSKFGKKVSTEQAICCIEQNPKIMGKKLFELTTDSGRRIKATDDHLLLTSKGWKKVKEINLEDTLVVYASLEGTKYEQRSEKIIDLSSFKEYCENNANRGKNRSFCRLSGREKNGLVRDSREAFASLNCGEGVVENLFEEFISPLREKNLLGIDYSDKRIAAFARVVGFFCGGGVVTRSGDAIVFTGKEKVLLGLRKDLAELGFKGDEVLLRKPRNPMGGRKVVGKVVSDKVVSSDKIASFELNSKSFVQLLVFLGAPVRGKVVAEHSVPEWVMKGTKLVKREFLRGLFAVSGSSLRVSGSGFEEISIRVDKSWSSKKNALFFYNQLRVLLRDFCVDARISLKSSSCEMLGATKQSVYFLRLKRNDKNIFNFLSKVGYAYDEEKNLKARLGGEYLRYKLNSVGNQKQGAMQLVSILGAGINRKVNSGVGRSIGFVVNESDGSAGCFQGSLLNYSDWERKFDAGNGFVFNKVVQIREVASSRVLDLTCVKNHNFVTNGFVSHNCNYSSKIIEPIQSRCVVYRFKPLGVGDIERQVRLIAEKEKIQVDDGAIKALNYVCQGDMRKTINVLQAASTLDKKITADVVYTVSSKAKPEQVQEMILLALRGKFIEARKKLEELMYEQGMSGEDVIMQLYRETMTLDEKELADKHKIELVSVIGEYDFRIVEGANERIQLEALLAQFMKYKK